MPIPALWCRLAIPPATAGRQVTTHTCPQVGCRNQRATASRSTHSSDLKLVRRAGMMVFSMILWMSVGHKLAHRCARRLPLPLRRPTRTRLTACSCLSGPAAAQACTSSVSRLGSYK
jgi:hypothetical protein